MAIKEGMKRVCVDIPEDMHEKITQFNKISTRPVNMSRVMELALTKEISKINTEILEYVKENGAETIINDTFYDGVLAEVKKNISPVEIQCAVVKNMRKNHYDTGRIGLYLVNRIEVNEETKEISFFDNETCCFKIVAFGDGGYVMGFNNSSAKSSGERGHKIDFDI